MPMTLAPSQHEQQTYSNTAADARSDAYNMTNPIPPMWSLLDWFRESMPPGIGAAR